MCSRDQFQDKLRQSEQAIVVLNGIRDDALRSVAMEQLVGELFSHELFRTIPQPPPSFGIVINKVVTMRILTCYYPFKVCSRVLGPSGSTVQAIARYSGCQIRLSDVQQGILDVYIIVNDYESIVDWRIEKAIEGINYVLINHNGQIALNQLAEQVVRRACRRIPPMSHGDGLGYANEAVEDEHAELETQADRTAILFDSGDNFHEHE